jgi:ectoine hydroxylase-related dioxygenase (phytanoyl-CoA dioxygenase family)
MTSTQQTLTPAQRDEFRESGLLVLKGVFAAEEVAGWIGESDRLWKAALRDGDPRVQWRGVVGGGEIADRLDPVWDISPLYHALIHQGTLLEIASSLLGERALPFKAKLIAKRPGTVGYQMHQDHPYWEFLGAPADAYLNVLVAFDRFDATSGATEGFPGQHHSRVPPPSDEPLDADEARMDTSRGVLIELDPGDIALFHSLLPHRSAPNRSTRERRGLFVTYHAARYAGLTKRYHEDRVTTHEFHRPPTSRVS